MSSKWKPESRILNNTLAVYCLLNQEDDTNSTDCDSFNEYVCIYGIELGSYCFFVMLTVQSEVI